MGKASNQKKKRRQGIGASRADLEGQRSLGQLAQGAQKLNSMFEARKEHLAAVSRSWWRGAEPEAAEVPNWTEGSAGDRFLSSSPRIAMASVLLPEPLCPTKPSTSPRRISNSTPRSTAFPA